MDEPSQYPIEFPHQPVLTEATFLPSPAHQQALDFLADTAFWPQGRLALWGGPGSGKTHLLTIWARNNGAAIVAGPDLVHPLWPEGPVAVDDIDRVGSEPALLHLLNAAAEARHKLLLTSTAAPGRVRVGLPDLQSRLRSIAAVEIGRVGDAFLAALLERLLSERQLPVTPTFRAWLLTRLPRSPGAIQEAVARLDRVALAAGSGVSRALASQALADLFQDDPRTEVP